MSTLHWGISIDGAGAHPAAWRLLPRRPASEWFDGTSIVQHAQRAEAGVFDLVALGDALSLQAGGEDVLRGRLDALLALATAGPLTSRIGLVPTVTTTHTEPFHLSKNLATLDWVSSGRAGWHAAVSTDPAEADHFGRKGVEPTSELWDEAADAIEVVRRLWDSWEDDAIIRDRASGRFVDRERLHYIDFVGERFAVRGPSIVPRSPQGQPLVLIEATDEHSTRVAASSADLVVVDATDPAAASARRQAVRGAVAAAGRDPDEVAVFARVEVLLGADERDATGRLARLDALGSWPITPGRPRLVTSVAGFVEAAASWSDHVDGLHLVPASLPTDLDLLVDIASPALVAAALAVPPPAAGTSLRQRFGLTRPASRYATSPILTSRGPA